MEKLEFGWVGDIFHIAEIRRVIAFLHLALDENLHALNEVFVIARGLNTARRA